MAIVRNMWMRNTRQQVAGAVLYNLRGQTIQREKAAQVANPRTTAQMDQRVKLANLVNFYRANKTWMAKGAFETKKQTWSDYNAFVSANLKESNVYLTKGQASAGVAICAPYIVTKGTLTPLNIDTDEVSTGNYGLGIIISAASVPTTWGGLSQALIDTYNGIKNGDQLSIIHYLQKETANGVVLHVKAEELILNVNSTELLTAVLPNWSVDASSMGYSAVTSDEGTEVAVSVCFSRTVAGAIKVSDSQVIMLNYAYYDDATDVGVSENAIASYGGSSTNFLDSATTGLSSAPSGSGGNSGGGSGSGDAGDVTP